MTEAGKQWAWKTKGMRGTLSDSGAANLEEVISQECAFWVTAFFDEVMKKAEEYRTNTWVGGIQWNQSECISNALHSVKKHLVG